jgi:hypothetical protein
VISFLKPILNLNNSVVRCRTRSTREATLKIITTIELYWEIPNEVFSAWITSVHFRSAHSFAEQVMRNWPASRSRLGLRPSRDLVLGRSGDYNHYCRQGFEPGYEHGRYDNGEYSNLDAVLSDRSWIRYRLYLTQPGPQGWECGHHNHESTKQV